MNDDLLLRFLDQGLIDVGGDDDKLNRLRQTATDLSTTLQKTPAKASAFALVAFDPFVPATDPTIAEVADALRNRWETYVNTFADTPVTVFRAMLLDALVQSCARSEVVAVAFAASARNVLPLTQVGDEEAIWIDVVRQVEAEVETRAEKEWATPASIIPPNLKFDPPANIDITVSSKKVDRNTLGQKLRDAAGPNYYDPTQGAIGTKGNPHWAQDTSGQWVTEFGTRAGAALAAAIDRSIASVSVETPDLPKIADEMIGIMSEHLTATLDTVSNATAGLQRRTALLWWKEALFSPSARASYTDMTTFDASVLMAFDLHQQVPTFAPISVAAFLRQTVKALPSVHQEDDIALRELVAKTQDSADLAEFRTTARALHPPPVGRCPILALIAYPETTLRTDDTFRDLVGVSPDSRLTMPEWSVWLFRELQAARAFAEAASPKRAAAGKRTTRTRSS